MHQLLDFPNEILENILDKSLPDGIESLAVCCKRLYACAGEAIKLHNTLRSTFSSSRLVLSSELPNGDDFGIAALLESPRGTAYVKTLCITKLARTRAEVIAITSGHRTHNPGSDSDPAWRAFFDISKCICQPCPRRPPPPESEVPQEELDQWLLEEPDTFLAPGSASYDVPTRMMFHHWKFEECDEITTTASILLNLLPNLRHVILEGLNEASTIIDTVRRNARLSHSLPVDCRHSAPLSRLTDLSVLHMGKSPGLYENFAMLPSMRSITIGHGRSLTNAGSDRTLSSLGSSKVESITIMNTEFAIEDLRGLVDYVRPLRSFSYK